MKEGNKNIIIVTTAVIAALVCVAITFWGNWKNNGVLTTDAFIGVLATFIGVCATFIVGVQIVNHMELKNMQKSIREIENERKILQEERDAFAVEMSNARMGIGNTLTLIAFTAQKQKDKVTEFNAWIHSIILDDWSSMNGKALLNRYQRIDELSISQVPAMDKETLIDVKKRLSILVVPEEIDHYDEIMALHYKLMSTLQSKIDLLSNSNNHSEE